ncbi:chromatin-remodeling ATPase INO80 isoform X1 [Rhinatrema bivittatum]|uniref:chromatin-remodeling ATPase INO80 isoform X1 n=1 Tax=Rhinatrema bivittatum TaxID=194408 RepID=UPI00112B3941|nr:chromatin-remodeling ATPase INO80 isoform X1 [Rhinatrema bivittatum]XP_029454456.1 chromatin-remodeling ATPase INO80 isoform X1 [Rhinatrema bivittatum]XP_029454457.1 chromatin-remodeling ATPase INO80 isoform X1 [Rhinatrema bivittatum]XP_029454458.1 chromatin-remodeling ATPase INO80 isoform X1 [Rhinatrema bivittatum]
MASQPGVGEDGYCTELAKPLYLQYLERALRLDQFLQQTSAIFNRNISSDESEDGLDDNPLLPQSGGPLIQVKEEPLDPLLGETSGAGSSGMLTTHSLNGVLQPEPKFEKGSLYNFSKLRKSRKWLKSILLSEDSSDTDSLSDEDGDEEEFSLSKDELHNMLRLHKYKKLHQSKYIKDKELQQYQYYSAGLLSTHDPFYEQQRHLLGPKKKEKKLKAKLKKVKKKRRRDEDLSEEDLPRRYHHAKVFAKFSNDAPLVVSKKKHLTIEQLNARRRKVWLSIVKKELPKAYKQKVSARNLFLTNSRKLAHQCMREVRRAAIQAQKNCKETLPRARRLTKEMLLYWKKYEKVEKEHRKRAEKEALEQRKLDEEMREAKRQQRKLNFLITQTELYAHFMSRKHDAGTDGIQEEILRKLEDSSIQRQIDIGGGVVVNITQEDYDSEYYKAQALKNAEDAYQIHQARTRSFDEDAKESRAAALRAASKSGSGFGESYSLANPSIRAGEDIPQPTIFNGKLKGYQLKGMNWLANLYEQGINGILADEMGLGKTVQSIALLAHLAERENIWGPFLIISPASTLNNWHQEFTRFVPRFKVLPYWGNPHDRKVIRKFWSQKTLYTQDAPFHVVITSYQLVVQDVKYFQRVKWQYMVLDEAQALKSSSSVRWKILLQFQCRNRLLLTGTPIQNTMAELWALLHFIMPTLFDSHEEFNEWFSKDIESHAENKSAIDENQLSRLHMILKPFMLRRIKKDVENELSDKIEILMYCQLTSRQKLLYQALKNKISIDDLLQSSMGTAQQAQTTTSSLMNLVMQFRKVCNHSELFERQETWSPFHISLKPYPISKFIYRHGQIAVFNHSRNRWLRVLLSPFAPDHIQQSLFHRRDIHEGSCFSFLRFIDMSPAEMANLMLQGHLARWLALFLSLKAAYRLHHLRSWAELHQEESRAQSSYLRNKDLLLWIISPLSFPNLQSCAELQNLVFTSYSKAIAGHLDLAIHRKKIAPCRVRCSQVTELPSFLTVAIPKVTAIPMESYCNDRTAEYERRALKEGGCLAAKQCMMNGSPELAADWTNRRFQFFPEFTGGLLAVRPQNGWSFIRIPDKESLITDSGKLYALDLLLTRLKTQGHRVLIYSQMTRMIDLLEEYMVYRKHTYMRLDGSSKISERRDMVADFQSRNDIFVFLLSTRAGGLGINLTAADTVIFYDSDWNPTVDQQAMDRAHRLGQTKQVTVYRLICKGTIEERILQRAKEKSEIQRMVISGGNFKPDTLKPKEVVSLLLDDEELEKKLRQRQEEKRQQEESNRVKERKRKREKYAEKKKKEDELDGKRKKEGLNLVIPFVPSADNSNLSADGDDSFISVDSAMPSPFSEISISSELHTGSIPPDESSSDMLVIVDDPASSAPQSRATNSPASITGSVSDTINGISSQDVPVTGRVHSGRSRGRPKGSSSGSKGGGKGRSRKSTAGSAAAMAGAMAGAAAASAAAYAAYGYNVSKGISTGSPLQTSLMRAAGFSDLGPVSASSPLSSPLSKGNGVPGTPKNINLTSTFISETPTRKQNKGASTPGGR